MPPTPTATVVAATTGPGASAGQEEAAAGVETTARALTAQKALDDAVASSNAAAGTTRAQAGSSPASTTTKSKKKSSSGSSSSGAETAVIVAFALSMLVLVTVLAVYFGRDKVRCPGSSQSHDMENPAVSYSNMEMNMVRKNSHQAILMSPSADTAGPEGGVPGGANAAAEKEKTSADILILAGLEPMKGAMARIRDICVHVCCCLGILGSACLNLASFYTYRCAWLA